MLSRGLSCRKLIVPCQHDSVILFGVLGLTIPELSRYDSLIRKILKQRHNRLIWVIIQFFQKTKKKLIDNVEQFEVHILSSPHVNSVRCCILSSSSSISSISYGWDCSRNVTAILGVAVAPCFALLSIQAL